MQRLKDRLTVTRRHTNVTVEQVVTSSAAPTITASTGGHQQSVVVAPTMELNEAAAAVSSDDDDLAAAIQRRREVEAAEGMFDADAPAPSASASLSSSEEEDGEEVNEKEDVVVAPLPMTSDRQDQLNALDMLALEEPEPLMPTLQRQRAMTEDEGMLPPLVPGDFRCADGFLSVQTKTFATGYDVIQIDVTNDDDIRSDDSAFTPVYTSVRELDPLARTFAERRLQLTTRADVPAPAPAAVDSDEEHELHAQAAVEEMEARLAAAAAAEDHKLEALVAERAQIMRRIEEEQRQRQAEREAKDAARPAMLAERIRLAAEKARKAAEERAALMDAHAEELKDDFIPQHSAPAVAPAPAPAPKEATTSVPAPKEAPVHALPPTVAPAPAPAADPALAATAQALTSVLLPHVPQPPAPRTTVFAEVPIPPSSIETIAPVPHPIPALGVVDDVSSDDDEPARALTGRKRRLTEVEEQGFAVAAALKRLEDAEPKTTKPVPKPKPEPVAKPVPTAIAPKLVLETIPSKAKPAKPKPSKKPVSEYSYDYYTYSDYTYSEPSYTPKSKSKPAPKKSTAPASKPQSRTHHK